MILEYDIIVIGGGHAGCEAASAAARLGSRTLLLTMDMTKMASMSCNPAVGGVAKGQIVREIDALGGQMGRITDLTTIQFRMLNRSKGAAMWSPRAQCDKSRFSAQWRHTLENTVNLYIWQDAATELLFDTAGVKPRIKGVRTQMGIEFACRAVVLTSGTFLGGMMHCGTSHAEGGRAGDAASHGITESLRAIGFETGRMKTGTPARLDARTIDFESLEPQYGDENPDKFSFSPDTQPVKHQLPCFLVYTSAEVHDLLRTGFDRSPLFNGTIKGIGPLHKIRGFEDLHIFRPGYAIEYDYFPPTQLHHSLETKLVSGLYFAGQVNGTTGYEEAAAQGLMAGINAHRALKGEEAVVLQRDEAYIGVLIDDLVTKGVDEPYRMFTSRAEYRILLRQDNADLRLTPIGYKIGLISQKRYAHFTEKKSSVESLISFARRQSIKAAEINDYLKSVNSEPLTQGRKLYDILMRNNVTFESLSEALPKLRKFISENNISAEAIEEAEIQIKYKGYIEREKFIAEKLHRLENIRIPEDFDFHSMNSLTIEARQKLTRIRPATIGQASRIPGVSPADVNVLLVKFGR